MTLDAWARPAWLAVALLAFPASAEARPTPYTTTVAGGDRVVAQVEFGSRAALGMPGRDALPGFANIKAYDIYYRTADNKAATDDEIGAIYRSLRRSHSATALVSGETVRVVSTVPDPEDSHYAACRVRVDKREWIVLCVGLTEAPA